MGVPDEEYATNVLEEAKERTSSLEDITWSEEEEKKLVRKCDRLVMPLLMFAFFALQLDRGMCTVFCGSFDLADMQKEISEML